MAAKNGKPQRETESLLIAAQNNAIRTNYAKAKIDNGQKNNKCSLCENINYTISEYSKLPQKECKNSKNCMGRGRKIEISPD